MLIMRLSPIILVGLFDSNNPSSADSQDDQGRADKRERAHLQGFTTSPLRPPAPATRALNVSAPAALEPDLPVPVNVAGTANGPANGHDLVVATLHRAYAQVAANPDDPKSPTMECPLSESTRLIEVRMLTWPQSLS